MLSVRLTEGFPWIRKIGRIVMWRLMGTFIFVRYTYTGAMTEELCAWSQHPLGTDIEVLKLKENLNIDLVGKIVSCGKYFHISPLWIRFEKYKSILFGLMCSRYFKRVLTLNWRFHAKLDYIWSCWLGVVKSRTRYVVGKVSTNYTILTKWSMQLIAWKNVCQQLVTAAIVGKLQFVNNKTGQNKTEYKAWVKWREICHEKFMDNRIEKRYIQEHTYMDIIKI